MLPRLLRSLGRHDSLPEVPTIEDLTTLGYDRGVATAAIRFLLAEHAAGRMDYYRKPRHADGWYVTLETLQATAPPHEYRRELGDWAHDWITGRLDAIAGEGGQSC